MKPQKKSVKSKHIKNELSKELFFLKNIFSAVSIPIHMKGNSNNDEFEITSETQPATNKQFPKRACSIVELEEKLQKIKSQNNFHLKNKLVKKSLSSKLNKKLKKKERLDRTKIKPGSGLQNGDKHINEVTHTNTKPIFNNEGKLVFSKFDFANIGKKDKIHKSSKNPKKILENMKQQEDKFKHLEETDSTDKVKQVKEKIAWKNIMQKAEGQKVKDDPILLKRAIKKMEQKKKVSKKRWENRISNVEQKKEERQKKRKENIGKKKKEKKSKIVKSAMKRGRVVI